VGERPFPPFSVSRSISHLPRSLGFRALAPARRQEPTIASIFPSPARLSRARERWNAINLRSHAVQGARRPAEIAQSPRRTIRLLAYLPVPPGRRFLSRAGGRRGLSEYVGFIFQTVRRLPAGEHGPRNSGRRPLLTGPLDRQGNRPESALPPRDRERIMARAGRSLERSLDAACTPRAEIHQAADPTPSTRRPGISPFPRRKSPVPVRSSGWPAGNRPALAGVGGPSSGRRARPISVSALRPQDFDENACAAAGRRLPPGGWSTGRSSALPPFSKDTRRQVSIGRSPPL